MSQELSVLNQVKINNISLDFIGHRHIWVNDRFDNHTKNLVQYLISEALYKTYPGQLEILCYDELLSGVFAPFSALSSGQNRLMTQITSEEELYKYLSHLKDHVRGVQNIIQGRFPSLYNLRELTKEVVENYRLVVIYADMFCMDEKTKRLLELLSNVGPTAGVSFLIISNLSSIEFSNREKNFHTINILNGEIECADLKTRTPFLSNEKIIQRTQRILATMLKTSKRSLEFSSLPILSDVDNTQWSAKSIDGLSFSVGKYGLDYATITLGDEINQRHNILITGAVGQGKSNLISVIIHSLCQNYSPEELNLYLLDFKEGVTLKPFANIGKEDYLPHVKALGLESDVTFGKAVLENLYQEYRKRLKLFKQYNKKSFREYRLAFPDKILPRLVIIIDEFHLMFGDNPEEGRVIADYLEKSVRLFRAAGIHFILASQTIGDNQFLISRMDSIFSQIPIRIAHKNSISESQRALGIGNTAATYLKPKEAIVNLDYGDISQNKKVLVAYADEEYLAPKRFDWWQKRKTLPAPIIFDSQNSLKLTRDIKILKKLKVDLKKDIAFYGKEIAVKNKFVFSTLKRETGHHVAIIGATGSKNHLALGMIQAMAISLAYLNSQSKPRFIFYSQFEKNTSEARIVNDMILATQELGAVSRVVESNNLYNKLEKELLARKSNPNLAELEDIYVFGIGMDRMKFPSNDTFVPMPTFGAFLEEAADYGIHFIGWWIKASSLEKQVFGMGTKPDLLNTKLFLKLDERSLKQFTGPFISWKPQANRSLYLDEVAREEPISFIPYSPLNSAELKQLIEQLN